MPAARVCPDLAQYQLLAAGQLPAPECASLLNHLESCPPCAARLQRVSAKDPLVDLIRQARSRAGETPGGQTVASLIAELRKLRPNAEASKATASIIIDCPGCGKKLRARTDLAGKKVKCPGCLSVLEVPRPPVTGEETTLPPVVPETVPPEPMSSGGAPLHPTGSYHRPVPGTKEWELCEFLAPAQAPDELGRLGPYRILAILGAGGMGVVYQAEDTQLKRPVALKAMLPTLGASESARKRFLREAQVAAAIDHDNIVHIYQVGEDRGVPFMAMQFLHGESLDERLKREKRLPMPEVLRIGRETAEGLAAAHERGLIHRDIKPPNLWLEGPRRRVKILDFGVARAVGDDAHLTQTGAIVGTPAYMAPEQAQGKAVDQRCDLFSLGCLLYRISTGQLPFKGSDTISMLAALALEDPPPPASLNPAVPEQFSELVLRLLAKKPDERPQSAQFIVRALHEIEQKTPRTDAVAVVDAETETKGRGKETLRGIVAAVQSLRGQRAWFGKKPPPLPWLLGMAGGLAAFVVLGLVLFWPTKRGLVKIETDDPSIEIVFDKNGPTVKGAGKEPISLSAGEHGVHIRRGDFEFDADKFVLRKGETVTLKVQLSPGKLQVTADGKVLGEGAVGKVADANPERLPTQVQMARPDMNAVEVRRFEGHEGPVTSVAYAQDGRHALSGSWDRTVRVWDVMTGEELRHFEGHVDIVWRVALSPDGRHGVSGGQDRVNAAGKRDYDLRVWAIDGPAQVQRLKGHQSTISGLVFAPDGHRLLSSSWDATVRLWDMDSGKQLDTLEFNGPVLSVAVSPGGRQIALGRLDGTVEVWDLDTHKCVGTFSHHTKGQIHTVAFSPNGQQVISGSQDQTICLWNLQTGEQALRLRGHTANVNAVGFSPDGRRILSASSDRTVRLWDAETGEEIHRFLGHTDEVWCVAFSPDGRYALSGGKDRTLRLWRLPVEDVKAREGPVGRGEAKPPLQQRAPEPVGQVRRVEPTVPTALGKSDERQAEALPLRGQQIIRRNGGIVFGVAFSPDGKCLVCATGAAIVWDAETGKELLTLHADKQGADSIAFSPDGKRLASAGMAGIVNVWDMASGKLVLSLEAGTKAWSALAYSPDGQYLASTSSDRTLKLWNATTGDEIMTLTGGGGVAFSPDSRRMAGSLGKSITVWELPGGQPALRLSLKHGILIGTVAFSPDGKQLAGGGGRLTGDLRRYETGELKVWDTASGRELLTLQGHTDLVKSVAFSPDGQRLASGSYDKTVKVWDARSGKLLLTLRGHTGVINSVAFSPDGKHVASGDWNGAVRIWDIVAILQQGPRVTRHEAEDLAVIDSHLCKTSRQRMTPWGEGRWSGDTQLLCRADKGGSVDLRLPIDQSGTYAIDLYATRATDYGKVRVSLGGQSLGGVIDAYGVQVEPTGPIRLGTIKCEAGSVVLHIDFLEKAVASRDYRFGVDCIDLVPADNSTNSREGSK
jgi:WD40 repeat protein